MLKSSLALSSPTSLNILHTFDRDDHGVYWLVDTMRSIETLYVLVYYMQSLMTHSVSSHTRAWVACVCNVFTMEDVGLELMRAPRVEDVHTYDPCQTHHHVNNEFSF